MVQWNHRTYSDLDSKSVECAGSQLELVSTNQIGGKQAQRRAAEDRSGRKYSKKYVFMSKNMTFGPLGHVLTLLNGPPDSYFLIFFFKHKISFIYCHIEPTCQKCGTYGEKCEFWLVRAPFALFKSLHPKLIENGNFQKWYFLLFSFVKLSLPAKNYVSITKSVNFGPLGPFCPF